MCTLPSRLAVALIVSIGLVIPAASWASEEEAPARDTVGLYLGGGLGLTVFEDDFNGQLDGVNGAELDGLRASDTTALAYKVFGGIRPIKYASLELAYIDMGELGGRCSASGSEGRCLSDLSGFSTVKGTLEVTGVELSAVGWYQALEYFEVFGKAGAFFWDGEAEVRATRSGSGEQITTSGDDDGVALIVGGGVHHTLFDRINARLEYQRAFDVMDGDINLITLSFQVDFDTPWAAPF